MKRFLYAISGQSRLRRLASFGLCLLVAAGAACSDDDGPTGIDDDVATVDFTSASQSVEMGGTVQLIFEIRDQSGNLVDPDDVDVVFTSSSTTVATVSGAGLVTAVGTGTTTITLGVGSVMDTITITVTPEISSIVFTLPDLDLVANETATLEITVLDMAGAPVANPGLTFTSSDEAVLTVDANGVITAVSEGTATITAEGGGETDTILVTVFASGTGGVSIEGGNSFAVGLGDALAIGGLVTVRGAGGVVIPGATLEFTSSDATVATVDATGQLSALAAGETLVTVTSPDATGSATFRIRVVDPAGVTALTLDPAAATITVGATVDLNAQAGTSGDPISDFLVVYTSSDATVATVDPVTGVVTGILAGTATITGTSGALTAESVITVQ